MKFLAGCLAVTTNDPVSSAECHRTTPSTADKRQPELA
jgi:hypothetical protein